MPRKPQVRFFDSKGAYFCNYNGTRHRLGDGPDDSPNGEKYLAALDAFKELMKAPAEQPDARDGRMIACIERWVEHISKHNSEKYASTSEGYLKRGIKRWGTLLVSQIQPRHIQEWLDSEEDWNSTTKDIANRRLMTALNWNVTQGFIRSHPLKGKGKPAGCETRARGEEFAHPEEFLKLLVEQATGRFRDYLTALWKTGARPKEIGQAEHYHYRRADGVLLFEGDPVRGYRHKNATKKKYGDRNRTIYLTPEVVEIVERNLAQKPQGFLFPSRQADHYEYDMARCAFDELRKKPAVREYMAAHGINPAHVILYSFRHSFATRALQRGTSIKLLADLMGTSVRMIESNYGHASKDKDVMRRTLSGVWS